MKKKVRSPLSNALAKADAARKEERIKIIRQRISTKQAVLDEINKIREHGVGGSSRNIKLIETAIDLLPLPERNPLRLKLNRAFIGRK